MKIIDNEILHALTTLAEATSKGEKYKYLDRLVSRCHESISRGELINVIETLADELKRQPKEIEFRQKHIQDIVEMCRGTIREAQRIIKAIDDNIVGIEKEALLKSLREFDYELEGMEIELDMMV